MDKPNEKAETTESVGGPVEWPEEGKYRWKVSEHTTIYGNCPLKIAVSLPRSPTSYLADRPGRTFVVPVLSTICEVQLLLHPALLSFVSESIPLFLVLAGDVLQDAASRDEVANSVNELCYAVCRASQSCGGTFFFRKVLAPDCKPERKRGLQKGWSG